MVKIEKYIGDNTLERSFTVPTFAFALGSALLPKAVLEGLANSGVDVREMLAAKRQHRPWSAVVEAWEHGVKKRIVLTLNN